MKHKILRLLLLALALASGTAEAAYVTVNSRVGWSCGTGTGGFESGCVPDVEWGTVSFTYNDEIIDTNANSDAGFYLNPLTSFEMRVEQQTRPELLFTLAGTSSIAFQLSSWGESLLTMTLAAFDESGSLGYGTFRLNAYSTRKYEVDSLPTTDFWSHVTAYGGEGYGVGETDWGNRFQAYEVPEPNSLLLTLGAGLLFVISRRSRSNLRKTKPKQAQTSAAIRRMFVAVLRRVERIAVPPDVCPTTPS